MQLQTESALIVSCFYFLRIKTNPSCMNSFSANFCSTYQQACIPKFITICADSTKKNTQLIKFYKGYLINMMA